MLRKRIITASILLPLFIIFAWFGNPWFLIGIIIVAAWAGWEFYRIASSLNVRPLTYFGLFIIILLQISLYCPQESIKLIIIAIATIISAIWLLFRKNIDNASSSLAWTLAGMLYIGLMISYWGNIMSLVNGRLWIAWIILSITACDVLAFFVGRKWGKHPMASTISPKKTWEGSIGGLLGCVAISIIFGIIFGLPLAHWQLAVLGIIMSLIAQAGDLVESLLKRNAGVKDSGNSLPGHGGILDRIDSYILIGPIIYYVIYFAL